MKWVIVGLAALAALVGLYGLLSGEISGAISIALFVPATVLLVEFLFPKNWPKRRTK